MNVHAFYSFALRPFRKSRMRLFRHLFSINSETDILDLGGSEFNWAFLPERPKLTILNLYPPPITAARWANYVIGDGCRLDYPARRFDIVFSNSVIEHVGSEERQRAFAAECARCGRSIFVQTPNKWFPIDLHTLLPFAHWLPNKIFRKVIRFSPRFLFFETDPGDFDDFANMRLLTKKQMRNLFPGAEIITERFLGMPKSLIAVKRS